MRIRVNFINLFLFLTSILLIIFLCGCTFKTNIASKAERLEYSLNRFNEEMNILEKKQQLSKKDQELIVVEINNFHNTFEEFKKEDVPFFLKKIKKSTVNKLNKKEKILFQIKQKAEMDKATVNDIHLIQKEIKDNMNINIFKK
ncbi:hypothetical protein J5Y03_15540 [Bacillus sp. RG28]|uniref:Lipoprotein n=1 Tax=Gottfriedia endophytica TaxID=2820819 RepID=A0A940SL06_9BACI|nr:hypothetical protein [Gottfriedia endophytica]MBP0726574.1 hypothetical protein [Gottfriedia endophytica]